jgi:hypothetical protein
MLVGRPNQHHVWPASAPARARLTGRAHQTEREEAEEERWWPELTAGGDSGEAEGTTRFASTPRIG